MVACMLSFLQKAAFEKRNKELKEWQDKQRDPAAEKLVSRLMSHFCYIKMDNFKDHQQHTEHSMPSMG